MNRYGVGQRMPLVTDTSGEGRGLSIQAVSDLLAIPAPTIRSWERRYGLARTARTGGGHRRYSTAEISDLRQMRDEISRGRRSREAAALVRDTVQASEPYRSFIEAFVDVADSMNPRQMDYLLDHCRDRFGVEDAICKVVMPGMRQIGVAWQTGRCDVTQEHLVTRAARGWLEKVLSEEPDPRHPESIVLSCGPGDLHTIGLEALEVLLARRGWKCHQLGERIPPDQLTTAIRRTKAAATILVSHIASRRRSAVVALQAADDTGTQLFYAGNAFLTPAARRAVPGTYLGEDLLVAVDVVTRALQYPAPA